LEAIEVAELNKRLSRFCEEIEGLKKEFELYARKELLLIKDYELKEAKLCLQWKTEGHPVYKIPKPTVDDLERMTKLELQKEYIDLLLAKKQKEIALTKCKMTETQISTIQSRLSYTKKEMELAGKA
jgi:hypothetical protein